MPEPNASSTAAALEVLAAAELVPVALPDEEPVAEELPVDVTPAAVPVEAPMEVDEPTAVN